MAFALIGPQLTIRLAAFSLFSLLVFVFLSRPFLQSSSPSLPSSPAPDSGCSPEDWSAGSWVRNPDAKPVIKPDDVYEISGFQGCASNREVPWHMANDHPDEFGWRGNVSSYEWRPASHCQVSNDYQESLLTELVQKGGWLLIGDSVTQEHFFSLSCTLYPHVLATPDYSGDAGYFDRAWPQNLYLNPKSPLASTIQAPTGFDIAKTPLVTFRRNDLLMNFTEIETLYDIGRRHTPIPTATSDNTTANRTGLFGKEQAWTISPTEYLETFLAPFPLNYRTLVVSTAGHWSLKLFEGLDAGYPAIFDLFRLVMTDWAYQSSLYLDAHKPTGASKEIVVRPYLPGDDNCHSNKIQNGGPVDKPQSLRGGSYNWEWIPYLNLAFEEVVKQRDHPHIHYLGIERPGRLRPDAHVLGDCMHWTVGAGVIENWTQYIYHFISTYLPNHPNPGSRVGRPAPYE